MDNNFEAKLESSINNLWNAIVAVGQSGGTTQTIEQANICKFALKRLILAKLAEALGGYGESK